MFLGGIRSLYTQSSYMNRPGKWISIDFRNTKAGKEKYRWVINNVTSEKIGLNVPLPENVVLNNKLKESQKLLSSTQPYKHAEKIFSNLQEILRKDHKIFKGDSIYVWEDLARLFEIMDLPDKAVTCFQIQADLNPSSSDPYLNMGVLYYNNGYYSKALSTYMKGLEVNPDDEYIYYNLSSLLMSEDNNIMALKKINSAILQNPERGINYKLKADIHFNRHEYNLAATSYEFALKKLDGSWSEAIEGCYLSLIEAYNKVGMLDKVNETRKAYKNYVGVD